MLGVQKKIEKKHKCPGLIKFIRTGGRETSANDQDKDGIFVQKEGDKRGASNEKPEAYKLVDEFDSEETSE